ncbi:MAG TPA: phospholipid carrier-dependent glycosyltransferase [Steroidobacteraceae bacterium]|nr:phospholipid carrier-dependent glycosyltransferase [Steroidobacteraceae bacterium]
MNASSQGAGSRAAARALYLLLALLIAGAWFAASAERPLFNPDEGRYAEIPREMLAGGDWVIPHLDGLVYIEKPPLQYWATAFCYRLFGVSAFSARLYTALTAIGTLLIVWFLARSLWNERAAWRAAAVLCSMALFPVVGQLLSLDMSLTFYMTASLAAFLVAQCRPQSAARAMPIAWAAAALGVLTKGLEAAAIPAATLILYSLTTRDFSVWRRLSIGVGLPLFLLIAVPWHWLAELRLADFLQFFIVKQHIARYLTPIADREEPWWFFGAVLLAGSLPWTASALGVLAGGWRARSADLGFDAPRFLWIWVVFVLVFFSLSESKLIPYLLPALPALAWLIAIRPAPALRRDVLVAAAVTLAAALACLIAGLDLPRLLAGVARRAYFLPLAAPLLRIAAVLGAAAVFALVNRHREATGGAVILGSGWCLGMLLLIGSAALVAPLYSGRGLAAALPAALRAVPIYSIATYDQTLPFYWRRTLTLVSYTGELGYGLRAAPQREIPSVDAFLPRWSAARQACAVMEIGMYGKLRARGVPMRLLGRDAHRVLVARR